MSDAQPSAFSPTEPSYVVAFVQRYMTHQNLTLPAFIEALGI